jgi:Domain of unknown function (DUF4157)
MKATLPTQSDASYSTPATFAPVRRGLLQRKCACGGTPGPSGECESCRRKRETGGLQRAADHPSYLTPYPSEVPPIVHEVLRSPGQPLDAATRAFMEPRFGHDFSQVRVRNDAQAGESARALSALAYTVGTDIMFADGQFRPETSLGRQLLAHELTHVVQQGGTATARSPHPRLTQDSAFSAAEEEAGRIATDIEAPNTGRGVSPYTVRQKEQTATLRRADPQAVRLTTHLGETRRTGIQFWPTNVTDTVVGPVSAAGGLMGGGINQLHVVIGANLTLSALAAELLPLWLTATRFTPPGAAAPLPLDIITQDQLAMALLVYNQTYLPVPAMTNWRAGLRFPLPAEIDPVTGVTTLHPLQIRGLATAFDPAWAPLLQRGATAIAAPPAATVHADVAAFLAREPTASGRGVELAARALTNASGELPFIREAFVQLGAASFDVALGFMDNLVNLEIQGLSSQRDGAAVLASIRAALAAAPAAPTPAQQDSLTRANLMLGLVVGAVAAPPPASTRSRPEKTLTVDTVKLDGSTHKPATDVAIANAIYAQCNVRIAPGIDATATRPQTLAWLGGNTDLAASPLCAVPSPEVTRLVQAATAQFGLNARVRAFFPATFSIAAGRGFSWAASCGPVASKRNTAIIQNSGTERTLAHELGHILLDPGPHQAAATQNVMVPTAVSPLAETFTDADCARIHRHV